MVIAPPEMKTMEKNTLRTGGQRQ